MTPTATIETEGTVTTTATDDEIAAYRDSLSPAERTAYDADVALLAATTEVDAATAEVNAARAIAAEGSTPATRSRVVRAQRALAAAQEVEILATERYNRAVTGGEPDDAAEVAALQRRIRAAVTAASLASGLYGRLAAVTSRSGLSQIGPAHAEALAGFAVATRALTHQQDAAQWPKSNTGGNDHV